MLAAALALAGAPALAGGEHDLAWYVAKAGESYAAKDYATFLDASLGARDLLPDHPRLGYNLACAYARNGRDLDAVAELDRLAAEGLYYPIAEDADFASIRDTARFRAAIDRFQANLVPVHRALPAFTLDRTGLIAEGLAYDRKAGSFFVGSVRERKVLRIDGAGTVHDLVADRAELLGAFGMRVDEKRRRLWVATSAIPQMAGFRPEDEGHSGLLEIDARTGKVVASHPIPGTAEKHNVADLTLDSKGNVYASDSETPAIYFLDRKGGTLQCLAVDAPFVSPQGLALSPDETKLYVADYARGVFVVDLATKKAAKLAHAADVCLHGIDGLAAAGSTLYATQNGIRPQRVVEIALDPSGARATRLDVLESNSPALGEPTLGVVANGWYYFVADSGWDQVDEKGNLARDLRHPTILKVKL